MTPRLTENDVHTACAEIASQGERPTALNLLDRLGRGSLTTISKHLTSWNQSDDAVALDAESLPAVVQLPDELTESGQDLLKKMWAVAKGIADKELAIQREALMQAEQANQAKVEEAFKFSEAQSMKIERLEEDFSTLKHQWDDELSQHKKTVDELNQAEKSMISLSKDHEQLQQTQENTCAQLKKTKDQLSSTKSELSNHQKQTLQLEKKISRLEGKLIVYESLDEVKKSSKQSKES